MTTNLKLVGAQTYYCEAFAGGFVENGGIVTVDDKLARKLLRETFMDSLNNVHPVFVQTDEEPVVIPDEDDEDQDGVAPETRSGSESVPQPAKKSRTRAAAG